MNQQRLSISIDKKVYDKLVEYHARRLLKARVSLSLSNTVQHILEEKLK